MKRRRTRSIVMGVSARNRNPARILLRFLTEEVIHAGERNRGTRPAGPPPGQGAEHAGRRIRSRRNRTRPRGQAWRPFDEAGHRDRTLESAPRGSEASAAQTRKGEHPEGRGERLARRSVRAQGIAAPGSSRSESPEAGTPSRGVAEGSVAPGG